jgi:hypothetical protein
MQWSWALLTGTEAPCVLVVWFGQTSPLPGGRSSCCGPGPCSQVLKLLVSWWFGGLVWSEISLPGTDPHAVGGPCGHGTIASFVWMVWFGNASSLPGKDPHAVALGLAQIVPLRTQIIFLYRCLGANSVIPYCLPVVTTLMLLNRIRRDNKEQKRYPKQMLTSLLRIRIRYPVPF